MLMDRLIPCEVHGEEGDMVPGWRWAGHDFDLLIFRVSWGYKGYLWDRRESNGPHSEVQGTDLEKVTLLFEGLLEKHIHFKGISAFVRVAGEDPF